MVAIVRLRAGLQKLRIRIRFYNRLMLYNTLIFLAVAYLFAFIASRYALQLDTVKHLQQSRDALSAVYNYYETKQSNFMNLVFSIYESPNNYNTLSEMLESLSDDKYDNDPFVKQRVVQMMEDVAVRDSDLAAILIYKKQTGANYLYTRKNRLLERVGADYPFFKQLKDKPPGRSSFGTRTLTSGNLSQQVYGISGTLGTDNIRQQAGQFLFAYRTEVLERIYQDYAGKAHGQIVIVSGEGEIIFDSGQISGSGGAGRMRTFPQMEILHSGAESVKIDGKPYYVQTIMNENRKYIAANLIPKHEIDQKSSGTRILIYGLFTIMAFVCAVLYSVAGTFVSRRVNELIKGMKRVSSHNLSYRIPLSGRNDEFEEIAARFNLMCNELQMTINREYVSEIKKKNAELQALQAGINPHFLYNTLEAIRIKAADDGNLNVSEMIVMLANVYRSIVRDRTFIEIRKELNMCGMYLNIFSMRYSSNLDYSIRVDPNVMEYGIPKNLLQPMIENYFVHGIRLDQENNRFVIRGYLDDGDVCFIFEDNGRGIHRDRLGEVANSLNEDDPVKDIHYGLSNVNERIRLVYGESYGLRLESEEGSQTRVTVRIKAMTCEELEKNLNVAR